MLQVLGRRVGGGARPGEIISNHSEQYLGASLSDLL
jgi:hypothetical protein